MAINRPNVFDFTEYKPYLTAAIAAERRIQKGAQARLANRLGCQSAYLSMVQKDRADLSVEQAAATNVFFHHNERESHYFLLLVQRERAGTNVLKTYFNRQIELVLSENSTLTKRLVYSQVLSEEHCAVFYSAWYYMAIHMALTVPSLRRRDALCNYFRLPQETVNHVLDFLLASGLTTQEGGDYVVGPTRIHLGTNSPFSNQSHCNWRLQSVQTLQRPSRDNFHYSSVVSASRSDIPAIREIMIRAIESIRAVVKESPEEDLLCYNFDLFSLRQSSDA